ncbi:GNAT family N-acetyltransferase [Paraclostridium sordellii]|uniref:GNAT family N-acetyltransferase n=1 Tax=Paraclostridium sordellii TaxID=1505 RepID=UPI0005DDFFEE|nr:GNAT family protein [Paeniclostridium sordellii]CEO26533.1 acetyltransferase [[Clostridium] sordellii] [Paeniclostridium sordellii]CEP47648.1 acetyltransferase [[Clostridium] sordellii] [Paeniclostridium sordellii]CEP91045.1 acetyltransferase [[Clostridium] sordellii] [Paeniclostridium sordellii]
MMKSEKVTLRPIIKEDLTLINKWRNDYEVFKYLGGGYMPISIDQQSKWMDGMIDNTGNNKRFSILNEDKKFIGVIGLYNINWIHRTSEFGIYIGEKNQWGKGYAKESMNLILEFGFKVLNLRKVKLDVVVDNIAAIKMYKNLGFREVGIYKEERFIDNEYKDVLMMEFINTL